MSFLFRSLYCKIKSNTLISTVDKPNLTMKNFQLQHFNLRKLNLVSIHCWYLVGHRSPLPLHLHVRPQMDCEANRCLLKCMKNKYTFLQNRSEALEAARPIGAGAYPGFCSMKQLEVFLLPLDGMLVRHRSLPRKLSGFPQQFAGTHLYTWVERGTVRVKCLA